MVSIGKLFEDLMGLVGIKHYTKDETDSKYALKTEIPSNLTVDSSLNSTSTNPVQNKIIKSSLDNKVDKETGKGLFSGSYSDLTNKPSIPSKTSDLTNDGDGTNVFIKNNDSRLSDNRTPTNHTHGNITNDGKVGSTSGKPLITTTDGAITTGSFGSSSGTFCQGNDSRLSDARTPTSHTHSSADVKEASALSNIGSSANATQHTVNDNINTKLGLKANSSDVYTKSETFTQSEVTSAISNAVSNLSLFEVVESLPTSNIKTNRLYLVVNGESIANNSYDIFLRVNSDWEQLDSLEFNIANFYTKTETDTLLNGKVSTSDSRLTDSRTPKSHSHGDITNTGTLGTASGKPLITTTNGKITTGSFGSSSGTFCQGNDSRLSDARTPTSHTHTKSEISDFPSTMTPSSHTHTKSEISDFPSTMTPSSHAHGNITNDGKVGSTSGKPLITTTGGAVTTGSFGTSSGQFAEGNHTHSNYLTSHQDISGKIDTAGTGLSKSGTTLNHSNSVTALTTASLKKVKYDAQGHITGTSDVTSSDLPSHTHSYASTTHTHGSLANGGTLSSDITSVNKVAVTDSSNNLKTISQLPYSKISGTPTIVNNLTSGGTTSVLSAEQGKTLKGSLDTLSSDVSNLANTVSATTGDIEELQSSYTSLSTDVGNKVDKVSGKGLSTNDFTTTYKNALDNLSSTIATAVGNLELVEVVSSLPTTNIKTNKLYLVANTVNGTNNKYDVYIRVSSNWEKIDSLDFTISDYIKKSTTSGLVKNDGSIDTNTYVTTGDSRLTNQRTPSDGSVTNAKVASNAAIAFSKLNISKANITGLGIPGSDTTYSVATTNANGLMSSSDKTKLDGLATVATSGKASDLNNDSGFLTSHNPIDSSLSSSSENAVQNKVINTALGNKVDKVSGKGLSTNDFNATYKGYVDNLVSSSNTTKNAHVHGSIGSGGTLNSDITSVNKIAVTDSSNNLKTISQLPYSKVSGTPSLATVATSGKASDLTNDNSTFATGNHNHDGVYQPVGSYASSSHTHGGEWTTVTCNPGTLYVNPDLKLAQWIGSGTVSISSANTLTSMSTWKIGSSTYYPSSAVRIKASTTENLFAVIDSSGSIGFTCDKTGNGKSYNGVAMWKY